LTNLQHFPCACRNSETAEERKIKGEIREKISPPSHSAIVFAGGQGLPVVGAHLLTVGVGNGPVVTM